MQITASNSQIALAIALAGAGRQWALQSPSHVAAAIEDNIRFVRDRDSTNVAGCNLYRRGGNVMAVWNLSGHHEGEAEKAASFIKEADEVLQSIR